MSSPFSPLDQYTSDTQLGFPTASVVLASRDPSNTIDISYGSATLWLSDLNQGGSGNFFVQSGTSAGISTWTALSAGSAGGVSTISDGSTQVFPLVGNIALVGTASEITVTSSAPAHELIFSIPVGFIAPGSITSTTTMTVGTNLTVTNNATISNDLTVTNDATVGGNLSVTGTITFGGLSVDGTVAINTAGNGTTTIGNAVGSGAFTIDVGTGDLQINGNGNEIHVGDDAASNIIVIGNDTGTTALTLKAGTGNMLLSGAVTTTITIGDVAQTGTITLGLSTAGEDIHIGSADNTAAQIINIGNGNSAADSTVNILSGTGTSGVGVLALGNNRRVTTAGLCDVAPVASRTVTVGGGTITTAVTDTIDIGPDGATTNAGANKVVNINTGGVTLGSVLTNIASGNVTSGTHTTDIATGNRAAGTMAVNLLTGTGTKTFNLGNADGLTTSNVKGPFNVNVSQNNNTAINTGTSTGTIGIGNSLAGAITVASSAGVGVNAATASHFTVTGAAVDLTLSSVGGSVVITGTEAAVDAIQLNATTALGGIDVNVGTGGMTIDSAGLLSIDSAGTTNLTTTGAFDLTVQSTAGSVILSGGEAVTDAIQILSPAGGMAITATGAAGLDISIQNNGGSVNIGATENAALAVSVLANGGASETVVVRAQQGTGNAAVELKADAGGVTLTGGKASANAINLTASNAAGGITMSAGTGNINMTGNVIKSTNPAFLLNLGASQTNKTGTGTSYTIGTGATLTSVFDRGTNATTSGVFTAPVTGIYNLGGQITVTGTTIATTFVISLVTTARTYSNTFTRAAGSTDQTCSINVLANMTATDTAHLAIAVTGEAGDSDDISGSASPVTFFYGTLIG